MRLNNRIALVTGGGSGIGREISLTFAREGASVAVNDINPDGIQETIQLMGESAEKALAVQADVSDSQQVRKMFAAVLERYGTLDILVNNAGIGEVRGQEDYDRLNRIFEAQMAEMMAGGPVKTFWEVTQTMEDAEWDRMLKVHLYGTFYCTREALKAMEPKGYGRIINMASIAATEGLEAAPHYSAAKAGILGFTRAVAREVGMRGITVNAIAPGFIDTPMTQPFSPMVRAILVTNTPTHTVGQPKDVALAALYLAEEDNSFITGQIISPCGGWWMP
ncbi:MAG TPA: SDR family NAD(P)-dependent oxidoreductase [Blastocatellia bacterium]|nr:SDR family NAD(P)-dependent oxidoreductase [Blastocatellia bacterium]